ncbi:MAG: ParA family protein [Verrucomicrobiota bacterium]
MKIFAIVNQKGGVGKTTTAVNLSAALTELGKRVLLIDLDPQANTTSGLGMEAQQGMSLYPVLISEKAIEDQIQRTPYADLDIITSEIDLAGVEIELAALESPIHRVKETLEPMRSNESYDYAIIDCPPSVGILMTSALVAADGLIIPVQCEFYAMEGVTKIMDLVSKMEALNPSLSICGVIMTMYDARTRISQQVVADVREYLGNMVFETVIPRSVRISEAPSFGEPITKYDQWGIGSRNYRALAEEFVQRLEGVQAEA